MKLFKSKNDKYIDILSDKNKHSVFSIDETLRYIEKKILFVGEHGFPVDDNLGKIAKSFEFNIDTENKQLPYQNVFDEIVFRTKISDLIGEPDYPEDTILFRPVWVFYHFTDGAFIEEVAKGLINKNTDWAKIAIYFLKEDIACQGGDSYFFIFDKKGKWTVKFNTSLKDSKLYAKKFINH